MSTNKDYKSHTEDPPTHHLGQGRVLMQNTNYAYDHSGERRLKLTGDNKLLDVNADFMATYTILNEPTLYPSAYMVLTNKGYTNVTEVESRASSLALPRCSNVTERKHYYAGTLFHTHTNKFCYVIKSDYLCRTVFKAKKCDG